MIRQLSLFILWLMIPLLVSGATPTDQPQTEPPSPPVIQASARTAANVPAMETTLYGKVYTPPRTAFNFALMASSGQRVRLQDYRDHVVLLFFGYTACPDVCPTTLADIKSALAQLGAQAEEVTVLFITVDPARDTPAHLAEYLGYFHEDGFIGLSGSEAETAAIAYHYGAKFYREEGVTATSSYSVAHTTRLFLINRQSEWAMSMSYGTSADQLAANLRYWLAQ